MGLIRFIGSTCYQVDRAVRVCGGYYKSWNARKHSINQEKTRRKVGVESVAASSVVGHDED